MTLVSVMNRSIKFIYLVNLKYMATQLSALQYTLTQEN